MVNRAVRSSSFTMPDFFIHIQVISSDNQIIITIMKLMQDTRGDPSLQQAVQLSRELNAYACDAYVIACAIDQRASIFSLYSVLKDRARALKLDVLEVKSA